VGGVALAEAFPAAAIWPLAVVGPAVLVIALWGRSLRASFVVGLVFGLAFFFPLLSWLVNVAWYVWAGLAVSEAVIFAFLAIGQRLLLRLAGWPLAVGGWWVAAEALRARRPYAFPWGTLSMSQAGSPTARWAAIGGPTWLTFLLALAGACLAWLVLGAARERWPGAWLGSRLDAAWPARRLDAAWPTRRLDAAWPARRLDAAWLRRRALPALGFVGATGLALAGGLLPVDQAAPGGPSAVVAAVQGDVPQPRSLPDLLNDTDVLANHVAATEQLAAQVRSGARPAPDVVIWPENSVNLDPNLYPQVYAMVAEAVASINRPLLAGTVLQNPQRNTGQLWLPHRGPVGIYVKRQLVPFGEYIPFRSLLEKFTSLPKLQPYNFTPGHKAVVFRLGKIRLGDVICYEVGFNGLVRSEATAGANLLAVQSNDADFEIDGQTGETEQQVAMAQIQAIANDRSVVYSSTTGETAIIRPDGSIVAHSGIWRRALVEARVPLRDGTTLADRLGGWPEGVVTVATIAAFLWAVASAIASRRRTRRGQPVAR
jgi:apolipoprotein N-acyltransferase